MTARANYDADALKQLPIFAGMSDRERRELLDIAVVKQFKAGDEVLAQGKDGKDFWIILDGKCQVIRQASDTGGCAIVLAELEPPAHFGEMSFFHHAPHSASVRALTTIQLLRFQRQSYDELLQAGELAAYKLALNVVDVLADRLRRMDQWVTELVCSGPDEHQISEWARFRQKLFTGT